MTAVLHRPTMLTLACKRISLDVKPTVQQQILRELKILHHCNSPNIVGFYTSWHEAGDIVLLMECVLLPTPQWVFGADGGNAGTWMLGVWIRS